MENVELIIIGAGPAGLSAAIYSSRAGVQTLVLGCDPKIAGDYDIDNYFGFDETISGRDLMERGRRQAARFGADIVCDRVVGVYMEEDLSFKVKTENTAYAAQAVIIATGVSRIRPGIDNLNDYDGKGVSYCVSCDGFFYRGKPVMVLGEGNYAASQALELTNYTPYVTVCSQGKELSMSQDYLERLKEQNIPVLEKKVTRLEGENGLEKVVFEDDDTLAADGLFIAMGQASSSDFAYTLGLERDGSFVVADAEAKTNIPGVFAAGDCRGNFLQIAVAVGEGAIAARAAISHVKERRKIAKETS